MTNLLRRLAVLIVVITLDIALATIPCLSSGDRTRADLDLARELSSNTGATADRILAFKDMYGTWDKASKALLDSIPRKPLSLPQSLVDELIPLGYSFSDINEAYTLSLVLKSSPRDLIDFKPKMLSWRDYGRMLQDYQTSRAMMKDIGKFEKRKTKGKYNEHAPDLPGTRTEVLTKRHKLAPEHVRRLKGLNLDEEEILILLTLADIYGIPEEQAMDELQNESKDKDFKKNLAEPLAVLDKLVGGQRSQ